MAKIYLGLGSNVEPEKYLQLGIRELGQRFAVLEMSNIYRSKAVGFDGADFLNLVLGFDSDLSGRTNVILNGMLLGFSHEEVLQHLESIIEFSELGTFIDNPIKTYSTGMRARLGFSIAHTLAPDVLCIDEALGVGDVEFRKKSAQVVKAKLLSNQTVVLVSHQADVIRNLCNRAVWIEGGVSRMDGTPEEVVAAYEEYMCRSPSA